MTKPALLLFTSLYPYPWQPSRATFNFQQYQALSAHYNIHYLVPVPWLTWFRYFFTTLRQQQYPNVSYFPMFYIPGILRSFNGVFLLLSVLLCVVPFVRLLRAKRVLASWAFPDALVCGWLKRLAGYRLYIQCLGSDINVHQQHPRRRAMLAAAFSSADAVITVSEDLAKKARQISPAADVITIYNGVNFERFRLQNQQATAKSLIFIGNLIKTKGVFELLQAIKLLNDPEVTLHMVGGGPEAQALARTANELGMSNQVQFYGRLPHQQVSELLQHSQLLVLPSYSEGVPNVIMEALACGIPVVATSVGGIPEVVSEQSGVLLADHQPASIAAGIQQAWQQHWQPAHIRQSIQHHTWQANSIQLYTLIEQGREQCSALQRMETPHD